MEVAVMEHRLINPMFPKSSRSATHSCPMAAAVALLLAALLMLALLLPSIGRVGVDSQDQPLQPQAGFAL
jgi:hypothetical protein